MPGSRYRVKLKREKVIGILTTGHRAEVFSIRVDKNSKKKIVVFHGRRSLSVLRYQLSTGCNSSFKVEDCNHQVEILDADLDEMILLFIAVFSNLV